MRTVYVSLLAALSGGVAVWIAFWLFLSVIPQAVSIPFEASSAITLIALLVVGGVLASQGRPVEAAALLAGSAASWAVHEIQPLSICQHPEMSYAPCAESEIAAMVFPVLVLLVAAAAVGATAPSAGSR